MYDLAKGIINYFIGCQPDQENHSNLVLSVSQILLRTGSQ